MRIVVIQHEDLVAPAGIERWAAARPRVRLEVVRAYLGDALPDPPAVRYLIVLGGSMNVGDTEQHPWLAAEEEFLRRMVTRDDAQVLGICLGAQLLAHVLGARVGPAACKERGWWPVELTDEARSHPAFAGLPQTCMVFHAHGQVLELPEGAVRLAASEATPNQAFAVGPRLLGLQFHPEFTHAQLQHIAEVSPSRWTGPYVQPAEQFLQRHDLFVELSRHLDALLDGFFQPEPAARPDAVQV